MVKSYMNHLYRVKKWQMLRIWATYYRIPADNRDLNYAKYFSEGGRENISVR